MVIMTSQNDETLPTSSSNAISLEAENSRPSQTDQVVQPKKRKRYSKAWKDFKLVYIDGVPYGQSGRIERFEEVACLLHCSCKKNLDYDCPTRWNSTYLMLRTTLEYKEVFKKLSLTDSNYKSYPTEEQWSDAENVCRKLKLFYHITEQFSGTQYPTSS